MRTEMLIFSSLIFKGHSKDESQCIGIAKTVGIVIQKRAKPAACREREENEGGLEDSSPTEERHTSAILRLFAKQHYLYLAVGK